MLCKQLSVQKEVNLISFGKARHFSNVSVSYPFFPPGVSFSSKGQLISKCPFGIIVWTNIPTKLFLDFCPEYFCSFLGASLKLFGLPLNLVFNIINTEAYRKPQKASRKPPGRYKKFQGRNPEIISLVFLSKQ